MTYRSSFWSALTVGLLAIAPPATAQITAAPDGTGTVVTPGGGTFTITGGTQSGTNQFHSFSQFGLTAGQTAAFQANPGVQNVLSRVTGGNPSVINGLIQLTGGANPNFYLMNPAGVLFGPNASLNVPAAFVTTTANGIGLGGGWFSAVGGNNYAALNGAPDGRFALTMAQPGAIVNAGNLQASGSIWLIGGTVISTGTLSSGGNGNDDVVVVAANGTQIVQLSKPGNILSLQFQTTAGNPNLPNPVAFPIASLPALLTGGGFGNATGLTVNPDNTVTLIGSGLAVQNGDIVAQNVTSGGIFAPDNIVMAAAGNLTTGNLAFNRVLNLTATRHLTTGHLSGGDFFSITPNPSTQLTSQTGNVTVASIDVQGSIDIFAAGLFRATGLVTPAGFSLDDMSDYITYTPDLMPFLVAQTGETAANLETAINTSPLGTMLAINSTMPVSIRTYLGDIRIRYAGGTGTPIALAPNVTLQGSGTAPFVIGPTVTANPGDRYLPANPADTFATFAANPFSLVLNESYTPIAIPNGASGTIGGITRTVTTDGTLTVSTQDRVFGILPTTPAGPGPEPTTPTPNRGQPGNPNPLTTNLNPSNLESGQTVQQQPDGTASDPCETASTGEAASNNCQPTDEDEQILKVLE